MHVLMRKQLEQGRSVFAILGQLALAVQVCILGRVRWVPYQLTCAACRVLAYLGTYCFCVQGQYTPKSWRATRPPPSSYRRPVG